MNRPAYPSDLTDAQWDSIAPVVRTSGLGRKPKHPKRELLNGIFYQVRAGGSWRMMPHDLPPWGTVYKQFEHWRETGLWDRLVDALRGQVRTEANRSPEPTAGAIDTQSVRTGGQRGDCYGYDAGKQVAGRKRHLVVDTCGLLLAVVVQAASVQDPVGAPPVIAEAKRHAPALQLLWGDGRYSGPTVTAAATAAGLRVEVVEKPKDQKGFHVLKHRWVVERTFGWIGKYRRLAGRDFETNPRNSEAFIKVAMCNLMVRRLTQKYIWRKIT